MHYRTVQTCFWTDPNVTPLVSDSKLMALYLMTNPHSHVSGIYYLPFATIALEAGFKEYRIKSILDTLLHVKVDTARMVVWVENMLHHQARGEKAYRAAANQLQNLHNSPLINEFLIRYPQVRRYCIKSFLDRVFSVGPLKEEEEENKIPPDHPVLNAAASERKKRKRSLLLAEDMPIPEDWMPTENHEKLAKARGLELALEAAHFRGRAVEQGWLSGNWHLKFHNFLLQEVKFRQQRRR